MGHAQTLLLRAPFAPPEDEALALQCVSQPLSRQAEKVLLGLQDGFRPSHPTSSELGDPSHPPGRFCAVCSSFSCLQTSQWLSWLSNHPCLFPALTPPLNPKPGHLSTYQAPHTQPIKTNPLPGLKLVSVSRGSVKGLLLHPVAALTLSLRPRWSFMCPAAYLTSPRAWPMGIFNAHVTTGLPTPKLLLPVCPAQQMAALSFQLLRANPWSHRWVLFLPPALHTHPSTVPLRSTSGRYLHVLKYLW